MAKQSSTSAMNPLPSLIRASAWDAANARMRAAGRSKWTRGDYNEAGRTQERLLTACFSRPDDPDDKLKYIRFSYAEAMERSGLLTLYTKKFHETLDEHFAAYLASFEPQAA